MYNYSVLYFYYFCHNLSNFFYFFMLYLNIFYSKIIIHNSNEIINGVNVPTNHYSYVSVFRDLIVGILVARWNDASFHYYLVSYYRTYYLIYNTFLGFDFQYYPFL